MKRTWPRNLYRVVQLITCLLLVACSQALPISPAVPEPLAPLAVLGTPTFTPFQPIALVKSTLTPEPSSSPLPASITPTLQPTGNSQQLLWIDPILPAALRSAIQLPPGFSITDQAGDAKFKLAPGEGQIPASRWVYALVAPFPTKQEGVSSQELRSNWQGQGRPLLMDESTQGVFSAVWGPPASGATHILAVDELLAYAWDHRPALAIVPFEAVEPRWKVLQVDGQSPLHKEFDPQSYALTVPISYIGDFSGGGPLSSLVPQTNRDPSKLTVLAMTGVTALVRATAYTMEQQGIKYPGRDVREWLRNADLTHISNEVPFAKNCPYPDPVQPDMRFCSDPRYIALLEDVGTDIVELTGDHFQDWGEEAMEYTLELYKERGWLYYGGGADLEEGRRAAIVEDHGNRLAFVGCNAKGGSYAQAAAHHPGAVVCGDWFDEEIARLSKEGYLTIATFQHFEYYTYQAQPNQEKDFRAAAKAGAVIVSGSQAHQPQGMEFLGGDFIHYGLGNLFFDQYGVSEATRQAFIDRHVFYNGRYLGVELLPIVFVDYARPRPMNADERNELLNSVFSASGW